MSLCPEAELRAGMTDAEFWEHVLLRPEERGQDYEPELEEISNQGQPCTECGQTGPCAYDGDGRPMIHLVDGDDDR